MKIIYLHQYFATPDMPGGHRSYEMARRLVRAGHEVHMITGDPRATKSGMSWRTTTEAGIVVHWASVPYAQRMGYARRVLAFLHFAVAATMRAARLKGDVVFATSTPLTIAIPALLASALRRVPFVFEVRDMWPDVPIALGAVRNPLLVRAAKWLELVTYRRAAHVVALAPGMREDIIAKGIPGEKVSVIPNGCDLEVFSGNGAGPSPRDEHAWLGARKLVVCAGTVGRVHGVDYLARLARHVHALDPAVRLVVIGGGAERDRVQALAAAEGVLDRNFFMLPPMPQHELVRWLRAADLLVALIAGPRIVWKDAVQNKFFDALAAGKPIATNFDGWQSRIAAEAGVGVALDRDDLEAAAHTLVGVLRDDEWLAEVPERALQLAAGRFSRDELAGQLEVVLGAVAARG